jgi:hypothetical protein
LARHWLNNRTSLKSLWGKKPTREAAFQRTSEMLRGTIAQGDRDAIEASYEQVEKAIKRGEYIPFDDGLG